MPAATIGNTTTIAEQEILAQIKTFKFGSPGGNVHAGNLVDEMSLKTGVAAVGAVLFWLNWFENDSTYDLGVTVKLL